jgi:hypothetical protein
MKILEMSPFPAVYLYLWQTTLVKHFRRICKISKSLVISVRPPVHMEQLGSNWKDFHEISYLRLIRKSVEKFNFCYLTRITRTLLEDS